MNNATLIILLGIAYYAMGRLVEGCLSEAVTSTRDWMKVRLLVRYFWPAILMLLIITVPMGLFTHFRQVIRNQNNSLRK